MKTATWHKAIAQAVRLTLLHRARVCAHPFTRINIPYGDRYLYGEKGLREEGNKDFGIEVRRAARRLAFGVWPRQSPYAHGGVRRGVQVSATDRGRT